MKRILSILIIVSFAIGIVGILYMLAPGQNRNNNGFERVFYDVKLNLEAALETDKNSITGISGATASGFYFQTRTANRLIYTSSNLDKQHRFEFPFKTNEKFNSNFSLYIDSPRVYIFPHNTNLSILYNLSDSQYKSIQFPCSIYTREAVAKSNTLIIRGFSNNNPRYQSFVSADIRENSFNAKAFFQEQNDAGFSTDGLLQYDSLSGIVSYIFFYKNGIYCFDANLNTDYFIPTIDTVHISNIEFSGKPSRNGKYITYSNASPLLFINRESCQYNGLLYINSVLKADNENIDDFKNNSVIDVYSLKAKKYKGSFYLPSFMGEKVNRFKVFDDNILLAVYAKNIVKYEFSQDMLKP